MLYSDSVDPADLRRSQGKLDSGSRHGVGLTVCEWFTPPSCFLEKNSLRGLQHVDQGPHIGSYAGNQNPTAKINKNSPSKTGTVPNINTFLVTIHNNKNRDNKIGVMKEFIGLIFCYDEIYVSEHLQLWSVFVQYHWMFYTVYCSAWFNTVSTTHMILLLYIYSNIYI